MAAGRPKEAVELLNNYADELALDGFSAQSIAVLKKIQKIQPGLEDVEEKLAYLIAQQSRPAFDPWSRKPEPTPEPEPPAEIGFEPIDSAPASPPAAVPASPPEPAPPAPAPEAEVEMTDEAFRAELLGVIETTFVPRPDAPPVAGRAVTGTPLFRDFEKDELVDVIKELQLVTLEPGQILFAEGEPGHSLFVLTTGLVRAYVKDGAGHPRQVRLLGEGDFFGEISILSGRPRSATLTAATPCELLELDRRRLDEIAQKRPRVWKVLKEFYDQRANSTLEAEIRSGS